MKTRFYLAFILAFVFSPVYSFEPVYNYLDTNLTIQRYASSGGSCGSTYQSTWSGVLAYDVCASNYGMGPTYSCSGPTVTTAYPGYPYQTNCTKSGGTLAKGYWRVNSDTCPSGYSFDSASGKCKSLSLQCPSGYHLQSNQCISDIPTCTELGVNVNAFVAKCSEMINGNPTSCLNSDNTPFALQGCPQLDCPDGTKTTYPTPCPVASCPEGFTLSDVSGVGKTCVMPLPDDEQQNPCVNVSGSDVPLCAEDGKNCQMVNGTFVCLKEEITPPSDSTCYSINSKNYCLSNQPTIETEKTTTTNPDGSITVKEIMTPSINGVPARVKETTTHPDGSVTIISNNPGDLTDLGLQPQPTQKIDLSKVEKNTKDTADNTKSLLDLITGFFDLPSDVAALDESPIEFSGLQTAIDSDLSAFEGFVNEPNPMKAYYDSNPFAAAFTSMLPSDTSCGYVLETSIFGKSFRLAPCEKLEPLREILAWFFSILTAWQIVNITAKSIVRF